MYPTTEIGVLAQWVPLGSQNVEGYKKNFVFVFSKVVSPISIKFGMMCALGRSRSVIVIVTKFGL